MDLAGAGGLGAGVNPSRPLPMAGIARRIPLAVKFSIAFVALVTLVLLVNGAVNLWLAYGEARRAAVLVSQEKAQAAAERIGQFVADVESQIGWTTRSEWSRNSPEQRRYDFIRLLQHAPAITEVRYIDSDGKEQLKQSRLDPDVVGSGADFSTDPRFVEAVAKKIWYGPISFKRGSEPYFALSVAHGRKPPGVTAVEVNLKLIWDVVTAIKVGDKGYAYIVDKSGRLLAHPDMSLVLRASDWTKLPQVAKALSGTAGTTTENLAEIGRDIDGNAVLTASAGIAKLGWTVFVQLPESEALAPVIKAFWQTMALLGLGLLLATLMGSFLAHRMLVPIRRLQTGAERLGAGDFDQRIDIRTGDEIETLADRFNLMAGKIKESYETLEAKVEERTRDLNEALVHQTGTGNILKVIASSPTDIAPVLQAVAKSASGLCDAYDAAVLLKQGDDLYFRAHHGPIPIGLVKWPINRQWTAGRAVMDRVPVYVQDLQGPDGEEFTEGRELSIKMGHRTIVSVPLIREGESIGALVVRRREVQPFTEKQIELLRTFADQAVIAINNVHLFDEVQARTREVTQALERQTATSEILRVISQSPTDVQPVFVEIVRTAVRLLNCDLSHVIVCRSTTFQIVAGATPEGPHDELLHIDVPIDPVSNFPSRAIVEKRMLHVPDWSQINLPEHERHIRATIGVNSALYLPLLRDSDCVGLLTFVSKQANQFSASDIALAESFRDQALIAIANTQLFEEVQARTKEVTEALEYQTATSNVLNVISRSPSEVQPVLDTIVATAKQLCGAGETRIWMLRGKAFDLAAHTDADAARVKYLKANPIASGDGSLAGRAVLEQRIIHVEDITAIPGLESRVQAQTVNLRTMLVVPLVREGAAIGVISASRSEVRPFSTRQVHLLKTFADQAVIAIGNARLFEAEQTRTRELAASLENLHATQDRLIQSEKLASLGQLTAGIAHEIKNPLNFVNNFADVSRELVDELKDALAPGKAGLDDDTRAEVDELTGMLKDNLAKVTQHGRRADSIVKNMLLHSRSGVGERRKVDLNATVEESLNLAYHGARAEKPGFNITLEKSYDPAVGEVEIFPQEFIRVLLNLISNGFYAATKRKNEGLEAGYEPKLLLATKSLGDQVEICIRDNGTGIPDEVKAKMFNPFFTTKPAGEGTGLGLSLSFDIIKQHRGSIEVATQPGAFTQFTITLPRDEISGEKA